MGFGVKELNMLILVIDVEYFIVYLEKVIFLDEVGSVVVIFNVVNFIVVCYFEWRDASVVIFSYFEIEEFIGIEVKINRDVLYFVVMFLKDYEF